MKQKGIFLLMFCALICMRAGHALDYSGNVIIGAGEVIDDDIYITNNTILENNGVLRGNIIMGGAYDLIIKNRNTIESDFVTVTGATITQIVSSPNDVKPINNLSGHILKVQDATMVNMAGVVGIAGNASEIRMIDSSAIVGANIPDIGIPIYLNYDDLLIIDGTNLTRSCTLLTHVYGIPTMMTSGIDSMYAATPYMDGGGMLKIQLQRQTNYSIVFDGELGQYLDGLRDADANDKLVTQLDRANTRAGLRHVLSKSGRLNPIMLSRPIKVFNTLNDVRVFYDQDSMATITPFYISGDEFNIYGGAINASGTIQENIFARFGLFAGTMGYNGKFDEYNSVLYGGNFGVAYSDNDYYIGTFGTISYAKFKDISVFDDGKITKNPGGFAGRFGIDFGPVYKISDEIKAAPFVGGTLDYATVLNDNDLDFNMRGGFDMTVDTVQDGNKYNVGLRAFVQSDGGISAMLHSNMLSVADGVGGGINIGVLYSDSVVSYKIMGDINFLF